MVNFGNLFDEIKKLSSNSLDLIIIEFIILPEPERNNKYSPKKKNHYKHSKGFKISYHYENGIDNPELSYEGNINEDEIYNYLDQFYFNINLDFNKIRYSGSNEIDVLNFSLKLNIEDYIN